MASVLLSQPMPCPAVNAEMTPTCIEACIICDIDGFQGRHESSIVGSLPDDFCTFVVHNGQWIAFQAASVNLRIRINVSNCELNRGLELALYRSLDCNNFQIISNCFGGFNGNPISTGESGIVENTIPLVIGQFYYLAMDGGAGDNCDWEFTVLEGDTQVSPLSFTAPIQGASIICPQVMQEYSTEPELGAVLFDWTLNGQSIGDNTLPSVDLLLDDPGTYNLCVTGRNACDESTPTCKTIEVREIPETANSQEICDGECYEDDGNVFCNSGTFEYSLTLDNGCDSIIVLDLEVLPQPVNDISLNICEGDTIFIGSTPYFATGQYENTVQTALFCDSLINLDLEVIVCDLRAESFVSSVICYGESSGSIEFGVPLGNPPISYSWQHLQSGLSGTGVITNLNELSTIDNLPEGDLIIEFNDDFGFFDVIF